MDDSRLRPMGRVGGWWGRRMMLRMMRYEEYGCYEEEEEVVVGESYPRGPLNTTAECCSYPRGPHNTSFREFRFIQAIRVPPHKRTVQVGTCRLRSVTKWKKKLIIIVPLALMLTSKQIRKWFVENVWRVVINRKNTYLFNNFNFFSIFYWRSEFSYTLNAQLLV